MIATNFTMARSRFKEFCDKVTDETETVIVTRKAGKNVVIISAERYNELEKAERNAAFLGKLERGLAQVRAGQGIVKTMDGLKSIAEGRTFSQEGVDAHMRGRFTRRTPLTTV